MEGKIKMVLTKYDIYHVYADYERKNVYNKTISNDIYVILKIIC